MAHDAARRRRATGPSKAMSRGSRNRPRAELQGPPSVGGPPSVIRCDPVAENFCTRWARHGAARARRAPKHPLPACGQHGTRREAPTRSPAACPSEYGDGSCTSPRSALPSRRTSSSSRSHAGARRRSRPGRSLRASADRARIGVPSLGALVEPVGGRKRDLVRQRRDRLRDDLEVGGQTARGKQPLVGVVRHDAVAHRVSIGQRDDRRVERAKAPGTLAAIDRLQQSGTSASLRKITFFGVIGGWPSRPWSGRVTTQLFGWIRPGSRRPRRYRYRCVSCD